MSSKIDQTKINANFPIAGQNNDSQVFRDNFANIKVGLGHARNEITEIQNKALFKAPIGNSVLVNDMEWNLLYRTQLKSSSETVFDHGTKAGVVNFDYLEGTFQRVALTSSIIAQFTHFPPIGQAGRMVIWFNVPNSQFRVFLPDSVTYGLNNSQLDGRSIVFPGIGDYLVEIASIDNGQNYWFVDFANLGGAGSGTGSGVGGGYTGSQGSMGQLGYTGSRGPAGTFGGISFEYIYLATGGLGDPGEGFLSFNTTILSLATRMNINKSDSNIVDNSGFLRTIDDSTNPIKGYFKVVNVTDPTRFNIFAIGGLTEASGAAGGTPGMPGGGGTPGVSAGYFIVDCSYVSGIGSFNNLEPVVITFMRSGDVGPQGATGITGYTGSAGAFAGLGATGATGPLGATGATGPLGATGPQGVPGPMGPLGSTGATGATGASGATGATGPQGIPGEFAGIGATGYVGSQGDIGYTGSQGIPGVAAYRGATGATGPSGATGPIGATGMAGATGSSLPGYTGSAGVDGYTGSRGFQVEPGLEGQIPYIRSDGTSLIDLDYSVVDGMFVESAAELSAAQTNAAANTATIFSSWLRFSHDSSSAQPANSSETTAWSYSNATGQISSTVNSNTYIGFVSPDKYSYYTLEVRLFSPGVDDDNIGVICGWYVDPADGREYTLSALRDVGGTGFNWRIVYNYLRSDAKVILDYNATVSKVNPGGGWSAFGNIGATVKVVRNGNILEFETTQLGSSTYDPNTRVTLDLTSDPLLVKFTGASNYGYSAYSQEFATFDTITFSTIGNSIFDMNTGNAYVKTGNAWGLSSTINVFNSIGVGRILSNPTTKKLFFVKSQSKIIKIADTGGGGGGSVGYTGSQGTQGIQGNVGYTGSAGTGGGGGAMASRTTLTFTGNSTVTGFKSYALLSIGTSAAAWVRLYTSAAARTNDAGRSSAEDPIPGSGVIAELITGSAALIPFTPAVIGFNMDNPVADTIYIASTDPTNGGSIAGNITILKLEA